MVLLEREAWLAVDGELSVLLERRRLKGFRTCSDVRELSRRSDSRRDSEAVSLRWDWLLRDGMALTVVVERKCRRGICMEAGERDGDGDRGDDITEIGGRATAEALHLPVVMNWKEVTGTGKQQQT